jgi:hypothetical protein
MACLLKSKWFCQGIMDGIILDYQEEQKILPANIWNKWPLVSGTVLPVDRGPLHHRAIAAT